ncbi:MAG: class II glutamine amidotransferase [Acidobacteria bacterium]|nr:class II glutamine amidotransferase [Acidobacteriota bacterium]
MCRLYGITGNQPAPVECALVEAQNALLHQSILDSRGVANRDGWGIGVYQHGAPTVYKSARAAAHDVEFRNTAERVVSRNVIAHIRAATVGSSGLDNTHPFQHGPWLFAHNGTLTGFEKLEPQLEAEVPDHLLRQQQGETDSELMFLWLLGRMHEHGLDPLSGADSVNDILDLLATAIPELSHRAAAITREPARLNFLLTDGVHLGASRWGNSLYVTERAGYTDCEVCDATHLTGPGESRYRAIAIASEPITRETWIEVADHSFIGATNGNLVRAMAAQAA